MTQTKTLKINPRFQKIFAPLADDERSDLELLLKADGCMHPIVVWNDTILDGHNRYEICTRNSIPFKTESKDFTSEEEAEQWIRRFGNARRSLTSFAKIENAERLAALMGLNGDKLEKMTPEQKKKVFPHDAVPTMEKVIARKAKVSHGQVWQYNYIKDKIDDKTKEDLRQGNVTISEVHKKAKNRAYHEEEEKKKKITPIEVKNEFIVGLHPTDLTDAPIADDSLDVIITDPPYPREFLDCWRKLAEFAAKKLKPNGILIAMSGQSYLPTVYANMATKGLDYYWTGCIYTPGTSPNLRDKRLRTNWKPYLIYVKGDYGDRTFQSSDVYTSEYKDTADGQEYHKWGQSFPVFDALVKAYTYTTDVVCDPFLGGGTCAIACLENQRKFVGVEIDKEVFNIASNRITDHAAKGK